jgi:hypothetical protein
MPNEIIELTKYQFENSNILPYSNHVLIEMTQSNEGRKTKSGVIVGLTERVVYAEGDNSLAADLQECWGIVAKVPEKLYYCDTDNTSMDYETEMELQVNDIVWGGILEFANAIALKCEGKEYRIIPYSDLYVAKRHRWISKFDKKETTDVIVLNGNCLCQTLTRQKISELDHISESQVDPTKVIVKYIGKTNTRYKNEKNVDHQDLKVNDIVLLAPRCPMQYLERKTYMANFDGDNLYLIIPRRKIVAVISREEC